MVDGDRESGRRSRRGWLASALVFAFVAAAITGACSSGGNEPSVSTSGATACSATTVAGKLLPSVVTILVKNGSAAVSGSGEVIRSDGQILTNSHGALADCSGQMIGVPSAAASISSEPGAASTGSIGLGFAIPVDLAKAVSDELILHGAVTHSYFGMEVVLIPASSQSGKPSGF